MSAGLEAEQIRRAESDDAEAVARLICAFRDYYGDGGPDDAAVLSAVQRLLPDPSAEFLLAGEPPVGFAQLRYRLSVWTGTDDAWLEDLFVTDEARGKGIGRALIEACAERARERGCARIQLDTNEDNEAALALYEGAGFRLNKRPSDGRDLYLTRWL